MASKSLMAAKIKVVLAIFIAVTVAFGSFTVVLYLESQQKSATIKVQAADIEAKAASISEKASQIVSLEATVVNQSAVIQNQTISITQLNFTVSDQKDTIGRQISELRRRAENINLLEQNVSKLKGEVTQKEQEIVSLTPVTRDFYVAAVKGDGGGAIIPIEVKVLPKGTGLLSVTIKNVDIQSGAQESIRLAADVASKLSSIGLADKDVSVTFVNELADLVSVDGPSAGGAITTTIYAALTQKSIGGNTLMTGTIEASGAIGQVGGVDKKAQAAKDQGASRFLVPKGQKVSVTGIDVIEVDTIRDVLNYIVS